MRLIAVRLPWMAAALAASVMTMTASDARPAEAMPQELKNLGIELAVSAAAFGMCERFMPTDQASEILRGFTELDGDATTTTPAEEFLVPIMLKSYVDGRGAPEASMLTAESCRNLIRRQSDILEAARQRVASSVRPGTSR